MSIKVYNYFILFMIKLMIFWQTFNNYTLYCKDIA